MENVKCDLASEALKKNEFGAGDVHFEHLL
jgi:hypothetical protein